MSDDDRSRKVEDLIVDCEYLPAFMRGELMIQIPDDARVEAIKDCNGFRRFAFRISSKHYRSIPNGNIVIGKIARPEPCVPITEQHAHSLIELVKYFRKMVKDGVVPEGEGRSDALTTEYCDDLLEGLGFFEEKVEGFDDPTNPDDISPEEKNIHNALLYQLHHEFVGQTTKNEFVGEITKTVMVSQASIKTSDDLRKWKEDTEKHDPLPEGARWLVVPYGDSRFVMAVDPNEVTAS